VDFRRQVLSLSSKEAGKEGIWAVREKTGWFQRGSGKPVLLSTGPMNYVCAIPSRADGNSLFFGNARIDLGASVLRPVGKMAKAGF